MATVTRDGLAFDRGIERISFTRGEAVERLPDNTELPPAEAAMQSHLDLLFGHRDLDSWLMERFKPPLTNRSLLLPNVFKAVLESAAKSLGEAAQQQPSDAKVLKKAAALLTEAHKLNEYYKERSSELLLG